jgi:hypothetical protein
LSSLKLRGNFNSHHTVMQIIILLGLIMPFYGLTIDDFAEGFLLERKDRKIFLQDNSEVELLITEGLYNKIEDCAKSKGLSVVDFLSSVLRPPG